MANPYLEPHEQSHPNDWIEVSYCNPSGMGIKNWSSGSARMERRELSEFISSRVPILITDIITLIGAKTNE